MRKTISLFEWCKENLKPTDVIPTGMLVRATRYIIPVVGKPLVKGQFYTVTYKNIEGRWKDAQVWINAGNERIPWSIDCFEVDVYEKQKGLKSMHLIYEEL